MAPKREVFLLPWQYGWTALFAVGPGVVGVVGVGEFIKRLIQSRGNNGLSLSLSSTTERKKQTAKHRL